MRREIIKRILVLLLVPALVLCCFAGCGSEQEAPAAEETAAAQEPEEDAPAEPDEDAAATDDAESDTQKDEAATPAEVQEKPIEEDSGTQNANNDSNGAAENTGSQETPSAPSNTGTPEPTPAPAPEPQVQYCTLSISCATILNNMDKLTPGTEALIPAGGVILGATQVVYEDGDTVYTLLKRELQSRYMHYEFTGSGSSAYLNGLCNIYEFDCGNLSGWEYAVNGSFPSVGMGAYTLKAGDTIALLYTCDLGADIGDPIG